MRPYFALGLAAALVGSPAICRGQPVADRDLLACTRIIAAAERLACFDRAMAARTAGPAATLSVGAMPAGRDLPPAAVTASVLSPPAVAPPRQVRVAAGGGIGVGDYYGYFNHLGHGGRLWADSAAGSSGPLTSGQLWIDNWIGTDWTIGAEYLTLNNLGDLRVTLPRGLSILTDPIQGHARSSVVGGMGAINLAWRPATTLSLHPWISAGLAIGYGRAAISYSLQSPFFGTSTQTAEARSAFPALQAMLGLDIDLGNTFYISLLPRIIYADGHPFGLAQRYMDFALTSLLGARF